jgi:putative lipoic acid-binding regulatory protein
MVGAVEKATARTVDRRIQVVQRPSKAGKYLSVSIRSVSVHSGRQVLDVFREMKSSGGKQLKFII